MFLIPSMTFAHAMLSHIAACARHQCARHQYRRESEDWIVWEQREIEIARHREKNQEQTSWCLEWSKGAGHWGYLKSLHKRERLGARTFQFATWIFSKFGAVWVFLTFCGAIWGFSSMPSPMEEKMKAMSELSGEPGWCWTATKLPKGGFLL